MCGRNNSYRLRLQRGITVKEVILILLILILGGLYLSTRVFERLDEARSTKAQSDLERIAAALHQYKLDNQHYPYETQGLKALLEASEEDRSSWNGPYLQRSSLLYDPWKRPYQYLASNVPPTFAVSTLGADGEAGGKGADADIQIRFSSGGSLP